MNVFGIGLPEMAVIAAIALLVFGPKRLPELGRTLGRTLKGFQSASSEFEQEFRTAIATVESDPVQSEAIQSGALQSTRADTEALEAPGVEPAVQGSSPSQSTASDAPAG
jgi:sec-independent protein translocase protein TatA